jgi:WD40 repeat protein
MNLPTARILSAVLLCGLPLSAHAQDKVNFEDHVKPIFRAKCFSCHNTNKKTADLDLSNYTAMMQGGGSGASIEPGSPDDSYLFMVINHDTEPYMPPKSDKLPDEMIQTVRKWIEAGAPENSSSKVMLPKKPKVSLSVDVSAGARPEGPPPMPDVLGLEPIVHTAATTAVSAIATSPWAKLVAVAGQKQVVLYSSETLQPMGVLPFPEGQARVLKFSRNGALLLAGGGRGASKGLAVVWDIKTGERVMEVGDELDEVLAADISADQSLVAVGGPGKVVRVYSTATGELAYEIVKHTDWIYSLEFSPDSVLLATSDRAGGLHVWESYTGREYLTLNGHKGAVNAVSWRIDSNVLASASDDSSIKLWEMENGGNIKSWNAHGNGRLTVDGNGTVSMEFCRDGRVVSCGRDKVTKLWDQNGKQLLAFEAFADLALQVSHCDETNRVIAGDWGGEVRVWNAADGARLGNLTTNPPMLVARVQQAEAQVAPVNQKLAEVRKVFDAATAAKNGQVQKIEAAKVAYAASQKTLADRQAALKTQEGQLVASQKKQTEMQTKLTALQKAVPELTAAVAKAGMASDLMKDDAELKKVVEQLKTQVALRTKEMQQTDAAVKVIVAEVVKYTQAIAATKTQVVADGKQVAAQKANMDNQVAALKPFDEKLAAAQTQVNGAQAAANKAVADVARWKQYLALRDELKVLRQKQTEMETVQLASLEADAVLNEKNQQIATTQQLVQAKTQLLTDSQKKMAELTASVTAYDKEQVAVNGQVAANEKAIPMLQAAVAQVKAASAILPADAEIKNSAVSLEKAAAARVAALAALKTKLTTVAKQTQDAKAALAAVNVTIASTQKEMAAGQEMMKKLTAEAAPIVQQATAAKATLQAAEAELGKAKAVVDARKEQLRPQLLVTQAAAG